MRKVEKVVTKNYPWEVLKDMPESDIADVLEDVLKNNKLKRSMMKSLDYEDDVKFSMAVKHLKAKAIMMIENNMTPTLGSKEYKIEMHEGYYTYAVTELVMESKIKTEDIKETNMGKENIKTVDMGLGTLETYLEIYKRLNLVGGVVYKNMSREFEAYESEVDGKWILLDSAFDTLTHENVKGLTTKLYSILDAGKATLGLYNISLTPNGPDLKPFIYLTDKHIDVFEHLFTYSVEFRAIFIKAFGEAMTPTTLHGTLKIKDNFVNNHGSFLNLMKMVKEDDQSFDGLIEGGWRSIYGGRSDAVIVPKIVSKANPIDMKASEPLMEKPKDIVMPLQVKEEPIKAPDPISAAINSIDTVEVKQIPEDINTKDVMEMLGFISDFGDMADGILGKRLGIVSVDDFLSLTNVEQANKLELFKTEKSNMIDWIKSSVKEYNLIASRLESGATPVEALGDLYAVAGKPDTKEEPVVPEVITHVNEDDIAIYNNVKPLLITNGTDELIKDVVAVINKTITVGPFVAEHDELPIIKSTTSKYDFYRVMYIISRTLEFLKIEGKFPASGMFDSSAHKVMDEMLDTYDVIEDNESKIGVQDQKMFGRAKDLFNSNVNMADRAAVEEIVGFTFTQLNELDTRTTKQRFKEILYAMVWALINNGNSQLIKEHHIYDLDRCVNTLEDELVSKFGKLKTTPSLPGTAAQDLLNLIMGGK